ncbi:hypothetical protein A9Q99_10485 [Gammaproteobacteria bacterium 45_16_T64]|nr:hypothetical protein A9Q99_10485 [Gammaproteobacteria bacterium 45_16_T64]
MIISEMRESQASHDVKTDQTMDTGDAPRRSLSSRTQEKIHTMWLAIVSAVALAWKNIKHKRAAADSESPPFIGITDSEETLIDDEPTVKTKKTYAGPNFFERLTMKGMSLEGPLIREEYGTTSEMGEKNSLIILATRAYITIRRFVSGLVVVSNQAIRGYYKHYYHSYVTRTSKQGDLGKSSLHQKWKSARRNAGLKLTGLQHKFWNSLGVANKAEIEQLRSEVHYLREGLELRNTQPLSMVMSHDRRNHERRGEHLTVAYERRSLQRRTA